MSIFSLKNKKVAVIGGSGALCFVTGTVIPIDGGFNAYSGV